MHTKKRIITIMALTVIMIFSFSAIADTAELPANATMQEVVNYLILDYAGVSQHAFRTGTNGNTDRNSLAESGDHKKGLPGGDML